MSDSNRIKDISQKVFGAFLMLKDEFPAECRLHNFPTGCCVDATFVLGKILIDYGFNCIRCIEQTYGRLPSLNPSNHVWLMWKNYNIDLTFGQFDKTYENRILFTFNHPLAKNKCHAIKTWPPNWITGEYVYKDLKNSQDSPLWLIKLIKDNM